MVVTALLRGPCVLVGVIFYQLKTFIRQLYVWCFYEAHGEASFLCLLSFSPRVLDLDCASGAPLKLWKKLIPKIHHRPSELDNVKVRPGLEVAEVVWICITTAENQGCSRGILQCDISTPTVFVLKEIVFLSGMGHTQITSP